MGITDSCEASVILNEQRMKDLDVSARNLLLGGQILRFAQDDN